ncbi:MAG: lytic murein transglycosylase [Alphaproteobacteria bacterium]|nr:lytic murein transglycosylase [Alphaproteobacteria bacterium]
MINYIKHIFLLAVLTCFSVPGAAQAEPFEQWLAGFHARAAKAGISTETLEESLANIQPIQRVIDLDRKQPEGKLTFAEYRKRVINDRRILDGREMLHRHRETLAEVESRFGVPPKYVVALWGIETSYGANTGGFEVVPALATLAWEGRRGEFFTRELVDALRILDQGHIELHAMKGSWAGAMGQNQFMPSSFHNFAVDFDGDGHKDIWNTYADVFGSTANYLARNGWNPDERWGRAVALPKSFPASLTGTDVRKPLEEWKNLGVTLPGGAPIPVVGGMRASIVAPDGIGGPAFLVYDNYRVFLSWNRSTYFATAVGLLADSIAH